MSIIKTIQKKIQLNEAFLLMFDYDGTLTPIVEKPELAILDPIIKEDLVKLSNYKNIKVAIVSGRSIKTIQKLTSIGHSSVEMYGLHGGEILENGKISVNVSEKCKIQIKNLKNSIKDLSKLDGIILEDKEYSLSLHYRLANSSDSAYAINEFKNNVNELGLLENFRYQEGKMVVEILPINFNKSKVVNFLLKKYPNHTPIYFGDDKTDIFAFKEVKKYNGYAIAVGDKDLFTADEFMEVEQISDFIKDILNNKSEV